MWTAQRGRRVQREEIPQSQVGGVTVSELPLGVYLDGERRNLPLYTPGGYCWKPKVGDHVLVMKTDSGGCVLGTPQTEDDLTAGEIKISGGGSQIYLTSAGEIALSGQVKVNGTDLETLIIQLIADMLG